MTTRAQLESEREALRDVHAVIAAGLQRRANGFFVDTLTSTRAMADARDHAIIAALTASIARVEALLSLSDDMANNIAQGLAVRATMVTGVDIAHGCRTVADIVRRS